MDNETKIEIASFFVAAMITIPLVFGIVAIGVMVFGGANG